MKGVAFGVFDRLHEGHKHFLRTALTRAHELVVVAASPEAVKALKGKEPMQSLEERMTALTAFDTRITAIPGDTTLGAWSALTRFAPDIVFLGYDQDTLAEALKEKGARCERIDAFEPGTYKSSILNHS